MDATEIGRHAVCEFWGATNLDSVERAEHALRAAAVAGQVTLIDVFVHRFSPHGVSGVAVIAESHLAIHTWPELGYVAADLFTCGIASIIQSVGFWKIGVRLPLLQGVTFTAVSPMIAIAVLYVLGQFLG